jgi:3-oxoacyl-[acyl-carrier-protein] synthase-1
MGIWSCLGTDTESVAQALHDGRSGIGLQPERLDYGYRSALTGLVPTPEITRQMLDRHTRAGLAEQTQYAYMAARQALEAARLDDDYLKEHEVGCIFGNDSSARSVIEASNIMDEKHDTAMLGYGLVFQLMTSTVSMNLSRIFHLSGTSFTVSAACASGSHAIGTAAMLIRSGMQDIVLCGGAQEVGLKSVPSFDALGAFSMRMNAPQEASRPFDRERDGLVPSGGAAALVVEDMEHALRRGAPILAEVAGYGTSSGGTVSVPDETACATAMERALRDAGLEPRDIDYINAHATSTPLGDQCEAAALDRLFAREHALVSSTKSMTGHECWMAGASEAVYSTLMMQRGFVAPNINLTHPDEAAAHLNLTPETVETEVHTVLSNSFGFGGTNAALVLKKI